MTSYERDVRALKNAKRDLENATERLASAEARKSDGEIRIANEDIRRATGDIQTWEQVVAKGAPKKAPPIPAGENPYDTSFTER